MKRVVLKGFRHEDRHAIAAGLQAELTRLFAEPETAARVVNIGDTARLQAGNVYAEHIAKPQSVGTQTARGIARSIKA
jgi:hypothetical protein